jgi:hypothetical protein
VSRTPVVTVGIVVLVAFAVAVVLTAGTALVAAAGHIAGDIAIESSTAGEQSDAPAANATVPGVTANGTANISVVLESHRSTLSDRGYVAVTNTTRRANGSVTAARNQTYRATANGSALLVVEGETDGEGTTSRRTLWANDSYRFTREATAGTDSYDVAGRVPVTPVPPTTDPFATAFSRVDGEFVVTDAETDGDHRIVTLAAPLERTAGRNGDPGTLTLRVDDRGVVRNATATRPTADGTERMTYRLRSLGVERVPEPAWTDRVRANATVSERPAADERADETTAAGAG